MTIFSFLKNDRLACKHKQTNAQTVKNTVLAVCSIAKISVLKPSKSRFEQRAQTVKFTVLSSCSNRHFYGVTWCSNRLIYKYIQGYINPLYIYIYSPTACAHKIHQTKFTMQNF
jgi:hypothetical protein